MRKYLIRFLLLLLTAIAISNICWLSSRLGRISSTYLDARNDLYFGELKDLNKFQKPHRLENLLTIFTTFKEIQPIPHHRYARKVVLENWPLFKPFIRPVVFLNFTNSSLAERAKSLGWDVLPMSRTNTAGTPFLKDMYRTAFREYDSLFYGYANGDLVFDEGIVKTLIGVQKKMKFLENNVLLTGRRTNVPVDLNGTSTPLNFSVDNLKKLGKEKGTLIAAYAIDYFFFSKEGCSLNWTTLADVVIGRPAYDSYLVGMAAHQEVNVIDCTNTLLAVHISERGVLSHGRRNADSWFNDKQIGGKFNHADGFPTSAKLATATDIGNDVYVIRRR